MPVTRENLTTWFAEHAAVDPATLAEDTKRFSSSLIESFVMVDLILYLEDQSGRRIPPSDVSLDHLDSVGAILAYCGKARK